MNAIVLTMLTMSCHQSGETLPPPLIDVAPLIKDLGADYKTRMAAQRKLAAMGETIRPQLLAATRDKELEVARRAEMLLHWLNQDRRKRAMEAIDTALPEPLPWIDLAYILPYDMDARAALEPYYFAAPHGPEPREGCDSCWGKYRTATRAMCYDLAESGVPMWVIRSMIAELQAREEAWVKGRR